MPRHRACRQGHGDRYARLDLWRQPAGDGGGQRHSRRDARAGVPRPCHQDGRPAALGAGADYPQSRPSVRQRARQGADAGAEAQGRQRAARTGGASARPSRPADRRGGRGRGAHPAAAGDRGSAYRRGDRAAERGRAVFRFRVGLLMALRHFLDLSDAGGDAVAAMLADAVERKAARAGWPKGKADADAPLAGHVLAMVFEKNSTRTRVSFDMAIRQLGGTSIVLDAGSTQHGRGETVADTARILSGYADAIMVRTDDHAKIEEMAHYASVPVINGLTDASHPCQIVADLLTIIESGKSLPGLKVAWLGDGNNVLASTIEAAGLLHFDVVAACPQGFMPPE